MTQWKTFFSNENGLGSNTSKLNGMFKLVSSFAVNADRKTYLIEEVTSNIECMRQQNSIIEDRPNDRTGQSEIPWKMLMTSSERTELVHSIWFLTEVSGIWGWMESAFPFLWLLRYSQ